MDEGLLRISADPAHWVMASGLVAGWLAASRHWLRRGSAAVGGDVLVVHASQTGHAEELALRCGKRVAATGTDVAVIAADRLTAEALAAARCIFFIISTTGDGDAPDNASSFERGLMAGTVDLRGKELAVLALGDRRYQAFCLFGQRVHQWAEQSAGHAVPFLTVDDLADADLAQWDDFLDRHGFGEADAAPRHMPWRILSCAQMAAPSHDAQGRQTGGGLFRLELCPRTGIMPDWDIGDLFELRTPDGHLRDYSIASHRSEDRLVLFVRRVIDNGRPGRGSGILTGAEAGSTIVEGRVRDHRSFRPPAGSGPLLVIGAGSGWAGLRPHLIHAMEQGRSCWLIFGERSGSGGDRLMAEMTDWRDAGRLHRLDFALSQGGGPYVQDVVARHAKPIDDFLGAIGSIVLCGRYAMGEACLKAIGAQMGQNWLDRAVLDGRIRHDLY
jgi:sulfite reductase (NADPH) flavoprotein alpha-component